MLNEKLKHVSQRIQKLERQRHIAMDNLETSSHEFRRARSRFLIQLGGLIAKAGLLETFDISFGADLQKDADVKMQVAALYKGLLVLNELANSDDVHLPVWGRQGLQALAESNLKTSAKTCP
jgi:hypothetical protein